MAQGTIQDPKFAMAYMFAGRATVTFQSAKTGARFTYKIKPSDVDAFKAGKEVRFFVKFLSGPDNTRDYTYIGQVFHNEFTLTAKSRANGFSETTPAYIAFKAAYDSLKTATVMPKMLEVFHSGKCGRCNRKLTVPASVQSGFGPECINLVGGVGAPCPVVMPTIFSGIPQDGLHFKFPKPDPQEGFVLKFSKPSIKVSGREAAAALYAPANLDANIRSRIAEYKNNAPENYYQDGELEEEDAYKVAYNKFRVELTQGVR